MKILFLTNNEISYGLHDWLKKDGNDMILFKEKITAEVIESVQPDLIISYNYKYIIKEDVIEKMPENRIINLHISYLPWNRGAYPNIWSFLDNTPKGVSIHIIDKGLDTGKILLQKKVDIDENIHSLKTSYELLHFEIQKLFMENWEKIKNNEIKPFKQTGKGTIHYKKDFDEISKLLDECGWDIKISEFKRKYFKWRKDEESK